jgi:hypothetical protein
VCRRSQNKILDFTERSDPSLAFVMGGMVALNAAAH